MMHTHVTHCLDTPEARRKTGCLGINHKVTGQSDPGFSVTQYIWSWSASSLHEAVRAAASLFLPLPSVCPYLSSQGCLSPASCPDPRSGFSSLRMSPMCPRRPRISSRDSSAVGNTDWARMASRTSRSTLSLRGSTGTTSASWRHPTSLTSAVHLTRPTSTWMMTCCVTW